MHVTQKIINYRVASVVKIRLYGVGGRLKCEYGAQMFGRGKPEIMEKILP
jgi:hypothetical protein